MICTSYFSKLDPLENGEIHTSLINGRPSAESASEVLQVNKEKIIFFLQKLDRLLSNTFTG